MAGKQYQWYEKDQRRQEKPWMRHNDNKVAVNPERITTLIKLAKEHYGSKCARCGSKKKLTVHHRHYANLGFEKPVDDIVLLCAECHNDLHQRGKEKRLNRDDIPYVKPKWREWLEKIDPPQEGEGAELNQQPGPLDNGRLTWWRVVYVYNGLELVDVFCRRNIEQVRSTAEYFAECNSFQGIRSIEDLGERPSCVHYYCGSAGSVDIPLDPGQRDVLAYLRESRDKSLGSI